MFSKFLVVFVMALFATTTQAGVQAYQDSTNLGIYSKLKCGTDMKCANDAGKMKISTVGGMRSQVASTTTSITSAQCGSTFVNDSADVMTLPEASTVLGCRLSFACANASNFDVNPADASDQIGLVNVVTGTNTAVVLAPSAGDAIRCAAVGATVTLEAVGANLWVVIGAANGVWTDVD